MRGLFAARLNLWLGDVSHDTLLLFVGSKDVDDLAVSAALRADLEDNLEPQDILIVVRKNSFSVATASLQSSLFMQQVLNRFRPGVRMSIVAFDETGQEFARSPLRNGGVDSALPLEAVARPASTRIFRERKGFVESTPTYHFENPSGKHTKRFVRLSNILSAHAEISFLAFCLLREIADDTETIYTDTPSVFPLVSAYNEHRQLILPGSNQVGVENFSSYSIFKSNELFPVRKSVILISASSSGSLAKKIAEERSYPANQIWHMLYAGKNISAYQVICNLNWDEHDNPEGVRNHAPDYIEGSCEYCNADSVPIPLSGDQFELPGPQLESVQLAKADEPAGIRPLMAKYAGKGIFGVGMGARQSNFARQFNVDVPALAADSGFMKSFEYVLRRTVPDATRFVICLDDPSLPFAQMALERLNKDRPGHAVLLNRDQVNQISVDNLDAVAIVAAAVESGRSLLDLSRDLRSRCSVAPITYIIGVTKSNGSLRREELFNNLAMTNQGPKNEVIACESILLPTSSEGHAWHRERDLLSRMNSLGIDDPLLRDFVEKRLAMLKGNSSIFRDDLFWSNTEGGHLKVQPGFVYSTAGATTSYQQADVYFTISSVLQRLRARAWTSQTDRALRSNWLQQTLLSPENFGRFNDGAIQASLLRAASPRELNYCGDADASQEAARIIGRIVKNAAEPRGEAAAEFLLALATNTLQLKSADRELVLVSVDRSLPRIRLLAEFCEGK